MHSIRGVLIVQLTPGCPVANSYKKEVKLVPTQARFISIGFHQRPRRKAGKGRGRKKRGKRKKEKKGETDVMGARSTLPLIPPFQTGLACHSAAQPSPLV